MSYVIRESRNAVLARIRKEIGDWGNAGIGNFLPAAPEARPDRRDAIAELELLANDARSALRQAGLPHLLCEVQDFLRVRQHSHLVTIAILALETIDLLATSDTPLNAVTVLRAQLKSAISRINEGSPTSVLALMGGVDDVDVRRDVGSRVGLALRSAASAAVLCAPAFKWLAWDLRLEKMQDKLKRSSPGPIQQDLAELQDAIKRDLARAKLPTGVDQLRRASDLELDRELEQCMYVLHHVDVIRTRIAEGDVTSAVLQCLALGDTRECARIGRYGPQIRFRAISSIRGVRAVRQQIAAIAVAVEKGSKKKSQKKEQWCRWLFKEHVRSGASMHQCIKSCVTSVKEPPAYRTLERYLRKEKINAGNFSAIAHEREGREAASGSQKPRKPR